MSRIAIKSKTKRKKIKVPYDAELNELRECRKICIIPVTM